MFIDAPELFVFQSKSIEIARERIELSGLVNVEIVSDFLENYNDLFDVGLALHACGGASDAVLEKYASDI